MDTQTLKNGIPKFAMDDVEIVLDELCSGYDKATECRMQKELFDHYQSAFDDAAGEGLGEEDAHEKVLQDLGWETTLMVGQVCRGLSYSHKWRIHNAVFGRDNYPFRSIWLMVAVVAGMAALVAEDALSAFEHDNWKLGFAIILVSLISSCGFIRLAYVRNFDTKKPPINGTDIKKRLLKHSYVMGLAFGCFFARDFVKDIFLDEMSAAMLVYPLVIGLLLIFMIAEPVYAFIRRWKKLYPDSRIF